MTALITGASSGIGRDMARILSDMGHDLIIVARNKDKLERLKRELKTNVEVIALDLSTTTNCMRLYEKTKKHNIDILINNAGFGVFGEFTTISLDKELDLIDLNIKAVHTLTKLYLTDMKKNNSGYILNVASSAAFAPGPLLSSYYASKAYVLRLTEGIYEELRRDNSKVSISILCPGPVKTNFNKNAGNIEFTMKSMESYDVAEYAIKKMFKHKLIIIPGFRIKLTKFLVRLVPDKLLLKVTYNVQRKKKRK